MRSKVLESGEAKSWAVILENGDEFSECLNRFAAENRLSASSFTAIGAFRDVLLGYFDWEKKDYRRNSISEQVEVLTLAGDISLDGGKPKIHAHVVVGKADGSAWGGHVMEAHVRPTLEIVIRESPRNLERAYDPESGLNPIRP